MTPDAGIVVDPAPTRWQAVARATQDHEAILPLLTRIAPDRPDIEPAGTGDLIATGHQPWLWHPGILAKDLAARAFACRVGGQAVHLVVDHDPLPPLQVDVPGQVGSALQAHTLPIHTTAAGVPPASLPPLEGAVVADRLARAAEKIDGDVTVDLGPLIAAWTAVPSGETLAAQLAAVLAALRAPVMPAPPVLFASTLHRLPAFAEMVEAMRADPIGCAAHYNDAVAAHPESRMAPLAQGQQRIELPLWALAWQVPRQRVYIDLRSHALITERGAPLEASTERATLAPRAVPMMALLRRAGCALFVHGTGGARYDPVTDRWWQTWRGTPLAPRVVVSADLCLAFGAPVADPADLAAARWRAHHLPHNLDRILGLQGADVDRKRALLASMHDDRDRTRRAAAFDEIHRINATWAGRHAAEIETAAQQVARARLGVTNRAVARRRDWCFALYDTAQLATLRDDLARNLGSNPAFGTP